MSKESIEFHVKSDDYFGTLATILNLFNQDPKNIKKNITNSEEIIKDLLYLQINYKIIKK